MKTLKKQTIWLLFTFTFFISPGCLGSFYNDEDKDESETQKFAKQVFAVVFDQSKSSKRLFPLSLENIDSLLSRVTRSGGEIAWVPINGAEPRIERIVFKDTSKAGSQTGVSRCRSALLEMFQTRNANRSRVFESLELAIRYLKEAHHDPEAQRYLLVISDFLEDSGSLSGQILGRGHTIKAKLKAEARAGHQILNLPAGVSCISIGAHPNQVSKMLTGEIYHFTTTDAAIEYLTQG